ncbi:MAG: hypothetical protein PVG98_15335 [Chromatiales bacterium]|jgi:hypothetical protein
MRELRPKELEADLGLEGYGAVVVVAQADGATRSHYLPFSQANEFNGIVRRGMFNGMPVVEGARSIEPTNRRALDLMKGGRSCRTVIIGYVKKEPDFPTPLDVLYRHEGSIWRRARGGKSARLDQDVEELKALGLFVPAARRFTISLEDRCEFAFGLFPEVVVVDCEEGIKRTIRHGLEFTGLPPHYYAKLREYLQAL